MTHRNYKVCSLRETNVLNMLLSIINRPIVRQNYMCWDVVSQHLKFNPVSSDSNVWKPGNGEI